MKAEGRILNLPVGLHPPHADWRVDITDVNWQSDVTGHEILQARSETFDIVDDSEIFCILECLIDT